MADDEVYELVTVRRSRGGVVLRERLKGSQIAVKSQFRLKAGDFLISKRQIVHGACGIVPPELDGAIVSNEYSVLRARPSLDLAFLNCLAHSIYFQQTCFHSSIGVHVEKMIFKLDEWMRWDFNLPSLAEQRRIAQILLTWDRSIERVDELVSNTRDLNAALTADLMTGKRRLLGFTAVRGEKALGDVCEFKGGAGFKNDAQGNSSGEIPFIKVSDMALRGNELNIINSKNWVSREVAKNMRITPMPARSTVFAKVGAALMLNKRRILNRSTIIDNNMMAAIPDEDQITSEYLFLYLCEVDLGKFVQAGAVPSVNQKHLTELAILLPSVKEQEAVGTVLMGAREYIRKIEEYRNLLQREKSALMQQLLGGSRRVDVAAEAA